MSYVLAMYDVRGKQDFIYRSSHIKEIIGGSAIIRDVFKDYLIKNDEKDEKGEPLGAQARIYTYDTEADSPEKFNKNNMKDRFEEGYIGEVVYEGGGNFLVIYKSKEDFIETNKKFTKALLKNIGTLKVLCTCIDIDLDLKDNYKTDRDKLYKRHTINENTEVVSRPINTLPFTMVDPTTSFPIVSRGNNDKELSLESKAKYEKYEKIKKENSGKGIVFPDETVLDMMVKDKGIDSLLAVIYIDGNNMGAKVKAELEKKDDGKAEIDESYEACVNKLRMFSSKLNKNYVTDRMESIAEYLNKKYGNDEKKNNNAKKRTIVAAGDEMTIICNAHDALEVVRAYFEGLPKEESSCAGIAIFHSHAPYAEVYRIAEECCESGKSYMKKQKEKDTCYVDFHYCQSGIGASLEKIRNKEVGDLCSKPWLVNRKENEAKKKAEVTIQHVDELVNELNKAGRSNIKGLLSAAKSGKSEFEMEVARINAHAKGEKMELSLKKMLGENRLTADEQMRYVYDIVSIYDLWFNKDKEASQNEYWNNKDNT